MFRKRLSLLTPLNKKIIILFLIFFFILSNFIFSLIFTQQAFFSLQKMDLQKAAQNSRPALIFPKILSTITFGTIKDLEIWQISLSLIPNLWQAEQDSNFLTQKFIQPVTENKSENKENDLNGIQQNLKKISTKLSSLEKAAPSAWIFQKLNLTHKLSTAHQLSLDSLILFEEILIKPHTFLVLLQNTGELRASGGFMGSYARIDLENGQIKELKIQDIYEPDGQFAGFVEAPAGAKIYLSGGAGLRLPDSNWHPDLPTSAQTTLSYFAFGQEKKIDSVITLNVDLMEKLLAIVGEIYLPDYGTTVTADNLTALARVDRHTFFAGSKQKTNFLEALFANLKIKLENLNKNQQQEIFQLITTALATKDIQLFSTHPQLQKIFEKHHLAGELLSPNPNEFYFYSLESNVGINKANQKVSREIHLDLKKDSTQVQIKFENQNLLSSLDYINYQRLILNPHTTIKSIIWNEEKITHYDEEIITNSHGIEFKQLGFLIPLKIGQKGLLEIILSNKECEIEECTVNLQKQSGLPATPYSITFQGQTKNLILQKDKMIQF